MKYRQICHAASGSAASSRNGRFAVKKPAIQTTPTTARMPHVAAGVDDPGRTISRSVSAQRGPSPELTRSTGARLRLCIDLAAGLGAAGSQRTEPPVSRTQSGQRTPPGVRIWHSGQMVRPHRSHSVQLVRSGCR